jgi:hypothetical protein
VNPSEKSPTFKLWDESHGGLRPKRRQAFSPPGGKPRQSCRGGGTSEEIEKMYVDSIIEKAFEEVGGDFKNPTKETLIQVIMKLKEYATGVFREREIIEKHAGEIKQLIDKLD